MWISSLPTTLCWKCCLFSHWMGLASLSGIICLWLWGFISGLSILFHCSACIYENTTLLITVWKRDNHSVVSDFLLPIDCSPPGSSVHGISQARILEWGAISSSRGSLNPGIEAASPVSPALQTDSLPSEPSGKPFTMYTSIKWGIWSDFYNHQSNDDWFDIYISNHYSAHLKCLNILFDNYTSMKLKRKRRASCGTVVKSLDPAKLIVN